MLKNRPFGYKFRRQYIIDRFIVDFYCVKKGLVIEVDGEIHDSQKEKDFEREGILRKLGCNILRFSNDDVINDLKQVTRMIKTYLSKEI